RRLAVRCALQRQRGRGLVLVAPKTPRSRRAIYLSELAVSALKEQRQRQEDRRRIAKRWTDSALVFTNRTGGGLEQGVVERALLQALADASPAFVCMIFATPRPAFCSLRARILRWFRIYSAIARSP